MSRRTMSRERVRAWFDGGEAARAVSDTVGYVLVFALITATIGSVFAFGVAGLDDRQQAEQVSNVERAFDVMADNIADLRRHSDRSRATEMRLAGGSIRMGEEAYLSVGHYDDSDALIEERNVTVQPIVYEHGDTEVVYEAGGVLRSDRGNAIMLSPPSLAATQPRTSLAVIGTVGRGDRTAVGGTRSVMVETERAPHRPVEVYEPGSGERVTVTIESKRAEAWERYFEDDDSFTSVSRSGDVVTADLDLSGVDEVRVSRVEVRVFFRG